MQQTAQQTVHPTAIALHKAEIALDNSTAALNAARFNQLHSPQAYQDAIAAQQIAIMAYESACAACSLYHRQSFGIDGEVKRRNQRSAEVPRSGNK
jgi:hypothetical protein